MERVNQEKQEWQQLACGNGSIIEGKPIDPKIMARMPASGKTFIQMTALEVVWDGIQKFLRGEPNPLG